MQYYDIIDIEKFVETTRVLVYQSFGSQSKLPEDLTNAISLLTKTEIAEMNDNLSQQESINILKQFCKRKRNKNTKEIKITMSEQGYMDYVEALNSRMISNMLSKLASQGIIETAFDEEINDFVFWKSDKNEKN